eukprot:jgi/Bigna1/145310/aug1.97_g20018
MLPKCLTLCSETPFLFDLYNRSVIKSDRHPDTNPKLYITPNRLSNQYFEPIKGTDCGAYNMPVFKSSESSAIFHVQPDSRPKLAVSNYSRTFPHTERIAPDGLSNEHFESIKDPDGGTFPHTERIAPDGLSNEHFESIKDPDGGTFPRTERIAPDGLSNEHFESIKDPDGGTFPRTERIAPDGLSNEHFESIKDPDGGTFPRTKRIAPDGLSNEHFESIKVPDPGAHFIANESANNNMQSNLSGLLLIFSVNECTWLQVRLRGDEDWDIPPVPSRGLLEVYDAGDWRAIDYSDFSSESSSVVCKELDYDSGVATLSDTIPLGGGIEPAATQVACSGAEDYFLDCSGNFFEGALCSSICSNIIYIHCKRHCRNSTGGIDNNMVFEPSTDRCEAYNGTAYRLSGTPFKQKGRIEYLSSGFWYSIAYGSSSAYSTSNRARFVNGVCRILGYDNGEASTSEGFGLAPPASFVISSNENPILSSKPQSSKPEKILGATCFKACNFTLEYFDLALDACLNITVFNCPAGQYLTPATLISNGNCSACAPGM